MRFRLAGATGVSNDGISVGASSGVGAWCNSDGRLIFERTNWDIRVDFVDRDRTAGRRAVTGSGGSTSKGG